MPGTMAGWISDSLFRLFFLVILLAVAAAEVPVRQAVDKNQLRSPNPERSPIIQPPDIQDINIPAGEPLVLTCLGKRTMDWQILNTNAGDKARIDQRELGTDSFQSTLTINSTVVPDTGRYRCFYANIPLSGGPEDEERDDVSLVNIFVNDPTQLFVPDPDAVGGLTFCTLTENKPSIIPCRPTYPGARVFLLNFQGKPIHEAEDIKFEPSAGFTVFYPNVFFSGEFTCRYEIEIEGIPYKQEEHLILHYLRDADNESPRPVIDSSRAKHVVAGSSVVLVCNVISGDDLLVDMKWEYPSTSTAARAQQVTERFNRTSENGYRYSLMQTTLTVSNVDQTQDKGQFVCVSTLTSSGMKTRASVSIHIFSEARRPIFASHLTADMNNKQLAYGSTLRLECTASGAPDPAYQWSKDGLIIEQCGTLRYENNGAILINDKIVAQDRGLYVCNASNFKGATLKQWRLKVTGSSPEEEEQRWIIGFASPAASVIVFTTLLVILGYRLKAERKRREVLEAMLKNGVAYHGGGDTIIDLSQNRTKTDTSSAQSHEPTS